MRFGRTPDNEPYLAAEQEARMRREREITRRHDLGFAECSSSDPLPPWECTVCGCMVSPRMMGKHRSRCTAEDNPGELTVTLRFDTADDRDEFLAEHIDRACSDILATVHLAGPDPRRGSD